MKQNIDMLDITTNNLEKYKCAIPVDLPDDEAANLAAVNYLFRVYNFILNKIILKFKENKIFEQNQIVTSSLFDPIYNRKFCSYRVIYDFYFLDQYFDCYHIFQIESYWIYEICHGQYVKQYHETKNAGKRVVNEEYFLGYFNADKQEPDYFKENGKQNAPNVGSRRDQN